MSNAQNEIKCKCGCGFNCLDYRLIEVIRDLESSFNGVVVIDSGNRCNDYNASIGGAPVSLHTKGVAIDLIIKNIPLLTIYNYLCNRYVGRYGIILETKHVHFDLRDKEYRENSGRLSK